MALPINSKIKEPAIAIRKDVKLNPVTPTPNINSAKNPPISAPTIPNNIAPSKPPRAG